MNSAEVLLETQINALREQQLTLESELGHPSGETHHHFHDVAVSMICGGQQRETNTMSTATTTAGVSGTASAEARADAALIAECETCCPLGCCPHCCLCPSCCAAPTSESAASTCECGGTDCARGHGGCRHRGYTRYYYNAASGRGVHPLPDDGRRRVSTTRGRSVTGVRAASTKETSTVRAPFAAGFPDTAPTPAEAPLLDREGLSLRERLAQIEAMRTKYSRMASRAMRDFQNTVNDHEGYEAERQRRLRTARPFSFEDRELSRPLRIREARIEEERRQREKAEQAMLHNRFKARAVPPTTFLNKYDVMVEEWCQRKLAVEMLAREKADRAKEEEAHVRQSAHELRRAREEMMGVRYDKHGKQITRSEAIRRAESADAARHRREATRPNVVPLEVQLKLWPALKEHEQVRKERLLHQAKQAREETDVYFRQTMPLLANPSSSAHLFAASTAALGVGTTTSTTTTTTTHGIVQAVGPTTTTAVSATVGGSAAAAATTGMASGALPGAASVVAPLSPPPVPAQPTQLPPGVGSVPLPPSGALPSPPPPSMPGLVTPPAPTAPVPIPTSAVPSTSAPPVTLPAGALPPPPAPAPAPLSTAAAPGAMPPPVGPAAQVPPAGTEVVTCTSGTTAVTPTPGARSAQAPADPLDVQRRYNPNLTFQPRLKPGVPNFERLWAEDRAALQARKQRRPPTTTKPFSLTPSEKENVCGRKRVTSRSVPAARTRSAGRAATRTAAGTSTTVTRSVSTTTKRAEAGTRSEALQDTNTVVTTTSATSAAQKDQTAVGTADAASTAQAAPPKGTRSHALRTQAVYRQYVERTAESANLHAAHGGANGSSARRSGEPADPVVDAYWRGVAERRRAVKERLATYLPVDPKLEHEEAIRTKVRTLRATMKENEASSKEKLEEMRTRVSQMPPVFAEPTHLNDLSKARAEAERDILQMLKDTGLEARTIRQVLVRPAAEASTDAVTGANVENKTTEGAEGGATVNASASKTGGSDKYSTSDFSSSSSSASDGSKDDDDTTSTSASEADKNKNGYGDDEFESSSSDSSV